VKKIKQEKEKIELFMGKKVFLSNMSKSLVKVGNQQLSIKDSNVTLLFSFDL
jgi:hypothetical protein